MLLLPINKEGKNQKLKKQKIDAAPFPWIKLACFNTDQAEFLQYLVYDGPLLYCLTNILSIEACGMSNREKKYTVIIGIYISCRISMDNWIAIATQLMQSINMSI